MTSVTLVTASTVEEEIFEWATYLGRSLARFPEQARPDLSLAAGNGGPSAQGLPTVYNGAIGRLDEDKIVVFVHDDVYLHDWFLESRLEEALDRFDIVGLAGSVNPDLTQPSWGLGFDDDLVPTGWQEGLERSGSVNHFDYAVPRPSWYGATPQRCQLVDGLFLAARVSTLRENGIRFDQQFAFHFYDLDFCRSALAAGLRIGTWPIAVTHASGGGFQTETFRLSARDYLAKWST